MMRLALLAIILAACTVPQDKPVEVQVRVLPDVPAGTDTRTLRKETVPVKPKKVATPKPVEKPVEPEPVNPIAECKNIKTDSPEETTRAKMACMTKGLGIPE